MKNKIRQNGLKLKNKNKKDNLHINHKCEEQKVLFTVKKGEREKGGVHFILGGHWGKASVVNCVVCCTV